MFPHEDAVRGQYDWKEMAGEQFMLVRMMEKHNVIPTLEDYCERLKINLDEDVQL